MGLYDNFLLPRFIACACGTKPIMKQREKVVPLAHGTVLEIGIGSGLNLPLYDGGKVDRVIGLDPSVASWKLAAKRAANVNFEVDFIGLSGEDIPLDAASVDTIVVTYSLCTIPDPVAALHSMSRVLRVEGKLFFCEHGAAPDTNVRKWQDTINPWWRKVCGGCNLNRDIPRLIESSGFQITDLDTIYLPGAPRFAGFNYWGTAVC